MKTLEQVQEHLKETYYDCSEKICGFLIGVELKDSKQVIKFLKEGDYVYKFDDFLEWFDGEDEVENNCPRTLWGRSLDVEYYGYNRLFEPPRDVVDATLVARAKFDSEKLFQDILKNISKSRKESESIYKYKGEERAILNKELDYKKEVLANLTGMATYYSDKNILVAIENLRKEIDEICGKLEEIINEE